MSVNENPNQDKTKSNEEFDSNRKVLIPDEISSKLPWLFLILPGFLSYACSNLISPGERLTDIEIIGYSFAFTIANIVLALPIFYLLAWLPGASRQTSQDIFGVAGRASGRTAVFYGVLVAISVLTGMVAGIIAERDSFYRLAKSLPLLNTPIQDSSKHPVDRILLQNQTGLSNYTDPSPDGRAYSEDRGYNTNQAWARFVLTDGSQLEGWPLYFDARHTESQIYITPACVIVNDGANLQTRPVSGPGVIVFEREIRKIILLDQNETKCSSYWRTKPELRESIREIADLKLYGAETDPKKVLNVGDQRK